jgi:fructose-1,6-bisphosphatase-3
MLLKEFSLDGKHSHIINGHVPVRTTKGESPIKGGGKLIVIDGGFSKAYQSTSGIAGYTLIFNTYNIRIVSHRPFAGRKEALFNNYDIANNSMVFERMDSRMKISETDNGRVLQAQADDLRRLLLAYRTGAVTENHKD